MEDRFRGDLSAEYALNERVYPHQIKLHKCVGQIIQQYFPRGSILEIGCGTGDTTKHVLDLAPNASYILLDKSETMLKQARENEKLWSNTQKIEFIHSDVLDYLEECEENSFNVVFTGYCLHNLDRDFRRRVLTGIQRVIKPNGIFIEEDIIYSDDSAKSNKEFDWLARQLNRYTLLGRDDLRRKWLKHITEDRNPIRMMTEEQLKKDLHDARFTLTERLKRYQSDAIFMARK